MKNLTNFKSSASNSIKTLNHSEMNNIQGGTATDDLAKWRKNIEDGMIDRRR